MPVLKNPNATVKLLFVGLLFCNIFIIDIDYM